MIKTVLSFLLLLVFSGCVSSPQVKPNEKVFEDEDTYILYGLRAEQLNEYNASSSIFNTLYVKSDKKEYIYRSLQNNLASSENSKVVSRVDEIIGDSLEDYVLVRMKVIALMQLEKLEEAKMLAIRLVEATKEVDDYILVSDIYIKQKKFDTAVKYLESAYTQDYSEVVLDKMAIILYVNLKRDKDAIAQLETHTRMHGCSKLICLRLAGFYSNENDIDGLLSVYLRLYEIEDTEEVSSKIVQIYGYKKDYLKLTEFLESGEIDDALLLQLYMNAKNYTKAFPLADKLYAKTGDVSYLGQSAIYEYESSEKKDKAMLSRVMHKLEKVVKIEQSPLYLNYLGYLLIEHKLNVKKGIKYVRMALKSDPKSAFYLDSLAWGYYKLGDCKRAYTLIKKVSKLEGGDDKEVLFHLKSIKTCFDKMKKKSLKKKSKKKKTTKKKGKEKK